MRLIKLIIIVSGIAFISYLVFVVGLGWITTHLKVIGKFFGEIVNGFKSVVNGG